MNKETEISKDISKSPPPWRRVGEVLGGEAAFPGEVHDIPGGGILLTKLDDVINWARSNSLWPLVFGTSCCAIEMMSTAASRYDMARFGAEVFRASPRQSDVMIVAGRVSQKMAPVLKNVYDQMLDPKWVIAMGDCSSSGGIYNNYAIIQGVDKIVNVDVYLAGCPPRPEALLDALMLLQKKIRNERPFTRKQST